MNVTVGSKSFRLIIVTVVVSPHLHTPDVPRMDASCGPSSALSQLNKHAQRDTTLQNEAARNRPQQFRSGPGIDARLNRDFSAFSSGRTQGIDTPVAQMPVPQGMREHTKSPEWVNSFNSLSLLQSHTPVQSDWLQQFMGSAQNTQQLANAGVAGYAEAMPMQRRPMFMPAMQMQQAPLHAEPQGISDEAMDLQFRQMEQELEEQEVQEAGPDKNESFAEAARQVRESMTHNGASEETQAKFGQSNFLRLMEQISENKVGLNAENDKLVERSDIAAHLSDPLRHERQPDYHVPPHDSTYPHPASRVTTELENIRSHLPDPLAHIKDGALPAGASLLQAAQIVSGGQVQAQLWMEDGNWDRPGSILDSAWQEVYDDYRHDDDFH